MRALFARLALADVNADVFRNIVSIRVAQDLYDDLSDDPADWQLAQLVESEAKPAPYRSRTPVIHRPFEDATWFNAIGWPFRHWQASRYSDGSFGVWYGGGSLETTIRETVHHWYHGLLGDAGFQNQVVVGERKVYLVACQAGLLDLRPHGKRFPDLVHATDYAFAQSIGQRVHREGHPGLLAPSVRHRGGECHVILNPAVLSQPRVTCFLSYALYGDRIVVNRDAEDVLLEIPTAEV